MQISNILCKSNESFILITLLHYFTHSVFIMFLRIGYFNSVIIRRRLRYMKQWRSSYHTSAMPFIRKHWLRYDRKTVSSNHFNSENNLGKMSLTVIHLIGQISFLLFKKSKEKIVHSLNIKTFDLIVLLSSKHSTTWAKISIDHH